MTASLPLKEQLIPVAQDWGSELTWGFWGSFCQVITSLAVHAQKCVVVLLYAGYAQDDGGWSSFVSIWVRKSPWLRFVCSGRAVPWAAQLGGAGAGKAGAGMVGVAAYEFPHWGRVVPQKCKAELQNGLPHPLAQVEAPSLCPGPHRTTAEFCVRAVSSS